MIDSPLCDEIESAHHCDLQHDTHMYKESMHVAKCVCLYISTSPVYFIIYCIFHMQGNVRRMFMMVVSPEHGMEGHALLWEKPTTTYPRAIR